MKLINTPELEIERMMTQSFINEAKKDPATLLMISNLEGKEQAIQIHAEGPGVLAFQMIGHFLAKYIDEIDLKHFGKEMGEHKTYEDVLDNVLQIVEINTRMAFDHLQEAKKEEANA